MAVTKPKPPLQVFHPIWPNANDEAVSRALWSYDRFSDTMMVHFSGKPLPAVAVPIEVGPYDYVFARVDPHTERVVGVQIEDFLAFAIAEHPSWGWALGFARLNGITDEQVEDILRHLDHEPVDRPDAQTLAAELTALCA